MKRVIIQISELSKRNWRLIFQMLEKCNERGLFGEEDFNELKKYASIVIDDSPNEEKDAAGIEGLREIEYAELSRIGDSVYSILYKKMMKGKSSRICPAFSF